MRKFTSLLMLLLLFVGTAMAQVANKKYTVTCERGTLAVYNGHLASTSANAAPAAANFAFVSYGGNTYFFCVDENKFVDGSGVLVYTTTDVVNYPGSTGCMTIGGNGINMQSWEANAYRMAINSYATADGGNMYTITETGDFDPTEAIERLASNPTSEQIAAHYAQASITGSDAIVEGQLYTVNNARGKWINSAGEFKNTATSATGNYADPAQQFAFVIVDGKYYLYNKYASGFLNPDKSFVTNAPKNIIIVNTNDTNYPFYFKFSDTQVLNGGNGTMVINNWTTADDGNKNKVIAISGKALSDEELQAARDMITGGDVAATHYAKAGIASVSELANNKVYTPVTARGNWYNGGSAFASTAYPTAVTANPLDPAQQFAIIQKDGKYYIYNVAAVAYLEPDKSFVTVEPLPVNISETGNADYPFFFNFSDSQNINLDGAGTVFIDDWGTIDAGNSVKLIEIDGVTLDDATVNAAIAMLEIQDNTANAEANVMPYVNVAEEDFDTPFNLSLEAATEVVNAVLEAVADDDIVSYREYLNLKSMVDAGIVFPADGYYRVKNVSTGKYLRATSVSVRGGVVADLDLDNAESDVASIIEVRTVDEKPYLLSNGGWFNWTYLNYAGYEGWVSPSQDKYVHWLAKAPGQGAFSIALGNGEGEFANYLATGYYTVNGTGVIGGDGSGDASSWIFEPVEGFSIPLTAVEGKGYATVYLPFAAEIDPNSALACTVKVNGNGDEAKYTSIDDNIVPAETGVLIISETGAESAEFTLVSSAATVGDNDLTGHLFAAEEASALVLNKVDNKIGFYSLKSGATLAANRAFINNSDGNIRALKLVAGGNATGIQNVTTKAANEKVYDLQGRRVQNAQKGLYIVNGKKVIL